MPVTAVDHKCCGSDFWLYVMIIVGLVLFAGLMSGLTLGLMSLGLMDLEVLKRSGKINERNHAKRILKVVKNQHLLLVTLLIGNAVAMEALPLFLDSLTSPWVAVVISVTMILMFGEIVPQAICSRYGLAVGSTMVPLVKFMLVICYPISYPISKLLDKLLGTQHATLFCRSEIKTLVDMHGMEAGNGGELTRQETTIISGALLLAERVAGDAMTPISEAFSLDLDGKLNEKTLLAIKQTGRSRIPIYAGHVNNIIGFLLVKSLLALRKLEDMPIRDLAIRRIPYVPADLPLYDILQEFRQGRSHMAVVIAVKECAITEKKLEHVIKFRKTNSSRSSVVVPITSAMDMNGEGNLNSQEMQGTANLQAANAGMEGQQLPTAHVPASIRKTLGDTLREPFKEGSVDNPNDVRDASCTGYTSPGAKPSKSDSAYWMHVGLTDDDVQVVGIITMEDLIEQLLQEGISDEDEAVYHDTVVWANNSFANRSKLTTDVQAYVYGRQSSQGSLKNEGYQSPAGQTGYGGHMPPVAIPENSQEFVPEHRQALAFAASGGFFQGSRASSAHQSPLCTPSHTRHFSSASSPMSSPASVISNASRHTSIMYPPITYSRGASPAHSIRSSRCSVESTPTQSPRRTPSRPFQLPYSRSMSRSMTRSLPRMIAIKRLEMGQ